MLPDPDGKGNDRTTARQTLHLPALFSELPFDNFPSQLRAGFNFACRSTHAA
jgi:hypothetical protein